MRNKKSQARAKNLRNNPTDAERRLWQKLRHRQFKGFKFRRQYPVGPYIADFACIETRLIIELDGGQHAVNTAADLARDRFLASRGFRVIRFWNNQVLLETESVVDAILLVLHAPTLALPRKRGRELLTPSPARSAGEGRGGGKR